ncbi:MAG: Y-family DNA polymerase [Acidobacteriota bacterium]|nr:MAG: Y-family DNA polymerase [Acidobacteriota bacterium]
MNSIALIDANNFYATAEKAFDPRLARRPVIVLSNNDGCVVARSKEAKELGIGMGVPLFEVRHLVERHGVAVLSSNYELYADMSWRFQSALDDFSPEIEHYSIDEVFLRVPFRGGTELTEMGHRIRETVDGLTGITVSIGFAETKTLAKIAIELAKKSRKTGGVLDLTRSRYQAAALERVTVGDVWGVGPAYAELLERNGIRTALELRDADDDWIRRRMTVCGLRTVHELRGIPCIPFESTPKTRRMICVSRSFGRSIEDPNEIRAAVAWFTGRAAEKLRRDGLAAGKIAVFVSTDRFRDEPQYAGSVTLEVAPKSDNTLELLALALSALQKALRPGFLIRKAGVLLSELEMIDRIPLRLWEQRQYETHRRLMAAIDELNEKFGHETVRCGLYPLDGPWRTRFENVSPRYTTDWGQIMRVR